MRRPSIKIVARDRNGGYGGAVSRALPEAVQVADRWHLLENVSAAFLAAVQRSMPAIRKAVGAKTLDPKLLTAAEKLQYEGFRRRRQTNRMVQEMAGEGFPIKRIVRLTGLSRKLVRQILRGEREDVFRIRESSLTAWLPRLEREWSGGCRNGAELWRRLQAAGFRGSLRVVGEWATRQRRAEQAVPAGTGKSPPARRIARLLTMASGSPVQGRCGSGCADRSGVASLGGRPRIDRPVHGYGAQRTRGCLGRLARRGCRQHDRLLRPRPPEQTTPPLQPRCGSRGQTDKQRGRLIG